jgi:hypothetical protein
VEKKRTYYQSLCLVRTEKKLQLFLEVKFCYQCRWWKYQRINYHQSKNATCNGHLTANPIYASERGDSWDLFTAKVERKRNLILPCYFNQRRKLIASDKEGTWRIENAQNITLSQQTPTDPN